MLCHGRATVKTQCAVITHFPRMPQLYCARQVICAGPGLWGQSEVKWVTVGELSGLEQETKLAGNGGHVSTVAAS